MVSNGRALLTIWGGVMSGRTSFSSGALGLLLLVMLLAPLSSAEPNENGMELLVEFDSPDNGLFYTESGELQVTLKVKNHANVPRDLIYNPACPFDLQISSDEWAFDLNEERVCPTQSRAMTIQPNQERIVSTWNWDWGNAPSADLEMEFTISNQDITLQVSDSVTFRRITTMPENLQLNAVLAENIGDEYGHNNAMPAMIHVSLVNVGAESLTIPFDSNCRVQIIEVTELGCGEGVLESGDDVSLGWHAWDFFNAEEGEQIIPIELTAVENSQTNVVTFYSITPSNSEYNLIPSVTIDMNESLVWYFSLENTEDNPAKLLYESTCVVQSHIISPSGEIIHDTRDLQQCHQSRSEQKIDSLETYTIASDGWDYTGENGCEIDDGRYLLVLNQPDYGLVATESFDYTNSGNNPNCMNQEQDASQIQLSVNDLVVLDADSELERISFSIQLKNYGPNSVDLYWPTDCTLEMQLALSGKNTERMWFTSCQNIAGQHTVIDSMDEYNWGPIEIPFTEEGQEFAHGSWQLSISTTSLPSFSTQLAHTYDGIHRSPLAENVGDVTISDEPDLIVEEVVSMPEELVISGNWHYVTTSGVGCWLITDDSGVEHTYVAHMQDGGWYPTPLLSGTYVIEESDSVGDCKAWSGIVILKTVNETNNNEIVVIPEESESNPPSTIDLVVDLAPTSVAVVASTSLSIMMLLYIGNTEWIRIPALQIGLGLVAMVRKSGEHDGEYQRGRIMGYLTANPGVHFRALLGALEMSNGQLTHHLKHLESHERIWRRKDGRLVRFYPASIQSSLNDEDLPVPLLTPDPNSLQGKILRLLDATENDIVNLSQKELAIRLEASQQLVSHHLRTLEKFGLVEREKVGMRYRYQLTREAIFLVNSNEYDISTE